MKSKSLQPLVSVIMPVYKTGKYLEKSAESVLKQTYGNLELILVDDGSPDDAPAICDIIASNDYRCRVIHKENGGLSSARNAGIEVSMGDYILFLDSDDQLDENALQQMVCLLGDDIDIVIPDRYYKVYGNKKELVLHFKNSYFQKPIEFISKIIIGQGRAWRATAVLYKASIIKSFNLFFPLKQTSEDIFFNIDFLSKTKKIAFCDKPTLLNLKRSGSITKTYDKNYLNVINNIDLRCKEFSKEFNVEIKGEIASLYLRNIIMYAISLARYYKPIAEEAKSKKSMLDDLLSGSLVREYSEYNLTKPYFDGKFKRFVINICFYLIRHKKYKLLRNLIILL